MAAYVTFTGITTDQEDVVNVTNPVLMGYSVHETAGTGGTYAVEIVDGETVAGGTQVIHIADNADMSESAWFGPDGIDLSSGVSIEVVEGTVDITLFYKTS